MGTPVALGMMALGAGANALGAAQGAQANKDQLNYQALVSSQNATLAEAQARSALEVGVAQEQNVRQQTAQAVSAGRAAAASNGVVVDQGSAGEATAGTQLMGDVSALTVRDNAARAAWASNVQAYNSKQAAQYYTNAAGAIDPTRSAGLSLLGSAGSFATFFK